MTANQSSSDASIEPIKFRVIDYNQESIVDNSTLDFTECIQHKTTDTNSWINIDKISNTQGIKEFCEEFQLHPLMIEDILNTNLRPKMEEFESCVFVSVRMFRWRKQDKQIRSEQLSLVLGDKWLISFQQKKGDVFDPIRKRLADKSTNVRKHKIDYLFYKMLDAVVNNYLLVLEATGEQIDRMERRVLTEFDYEVVPDTIRWKKELSKVRKAIVPLRDCLLNLKGEVDMLEPRTKRYINDVYEQTLHVLDQLELQHESLAGVMNLHQTKIGNKMNNIMKILTIVMSIFIPLSFLAGLYGMNFDYIPELKHPKGYFIVLGVMAGIVLAMLLFFKRKKWI